MILAIIAIVLVGGVLAGPIMSDVEQPNYAVVSAQDNIEIRRYDPMIIAQVEVQGVREEAINEGFRLIADYIFGNNTVQQKIAMTAPVQQQASKAIAMTTPVQQVASANGWKVHFIMPAEYTLDTLPKPNNPLVVLEQIPAKKVAAIRFSGSSTQENIAKHEAQLTDYLSANQMQAIGVPSYAFYNPPWTLPALRRNEVMVEVE